MTALKQQAFRNVINSPFSKTNPDQSENAGLDVILEYVSENRRPGAYGHQTAAGSIFGDLFRDSGTYDPARREEVLLHFESYLARIHIVEEMLRAEALVRYFVKCVDDSSPIRNQTGFADLQRESENPLLSMVKFLRARVEADFSNGSAVEKSNAPSLRQLLDSLEQEFIEPMVNFRNRIAHGYSRAFDKGLRRSGKEKDSDLLATKIFEQADFVLAKCIKSNLDALTLVFNHLPMSLLREGGFCTDDLKGQQDLFRRTPFLALPRWQTGMAGSVAAMTDTNMKNFVESPAKALSDFWSSLRLT